MKRIVFFAAVFFFQAAGMAENTRGIQINWPLDRTYIPIGYNDNENIEIVVSGTLPDSCHKLGPALMALGPKDIGQPQFEVRQVVYKTEGDCTSNPQPFYKVLELGQADVGEYTIFDLTSRKDIGKLPVEKAKGSSVDDYPYPPISDALAVRNPDGTNTLMLVGEYTDRCMSIHNPPIIRYQRDAVIIQPVVDVRTGPDCGPAHIPFQEFYPLGKQAPDAFLLHVRSQNGTSVNKMTVLHHG